MYIYLLPSSSFPFLSISYSSRPLIYRGRWWTAVEENAHKGRVLDSLLRALYRGQQLLTLSKVGVPPVDDDALPPPPSEPFPPTMMAAQRMEEGAKRVLYAHSADEDLILEQWKFDPLKVSEVINDLVGFHLDRAGHEGSVRAATAYLQERPDLAVNRILSHIQYIFGVKSIDGIIPLMNQVYLFNEEMKNFLASMRVLLCRKESGGYLNGADRNLSNAIILDEIHRRMTLSLSLNT